jgi:hypothetical protein
MPAVWTTPITWSVDQLVTNDDLNEQVRDNLEYLLSPNHQQIIYNNGGNLTITNVVSFQDIDSANLTITLNTHGGPVLVRFMGSGRSNGTSNPCSLDLTVDGTRVGAAHTLGLLTLGIEGASWIPVNLSLLITGLAAGPHIFRPQWRTPASATFTLRSNSSDNPVVFEVIEL